VFGGAVRTITQATTGPVTFAMAAGGRELDIRCDLALVAVGAVDESGYSTSNLGDATMMAEMIDRADRTAVLADSSKLGRRLFAQVAPSRASITSSPTLPHLPLANALVQAGVSLVAPDRRGTAYNRTVGTIYYGARLLRSISRTGCSHT
jgi:DeoR family fructose operon transcriptional repressor